VQQWRVSEIRNPTPRRLGASVYRRNRIVDLRRAAEIYRGFGKSPYQSATGRKTVSKTLTPVGRPVGRRRDPREVRSSNTYCLSSHRRWPCPYARGVITSRNHETHYSGRLGVRGGIPGPDYLKYTLAHAQRPTPLPLHA